MARKLRTGFELPFSNASGSDQTKTLTGQDSYDYILNSLSDGMISVTTNQQVTSVGLASYIGLNIRQATDARTLSNGTRGCYFRGNAGNQYAISFKPGSFSSGFHANFWWKTTNASIYSHPLVLKDGSTIFNCAIGASEMSIEEGSATTQRATASITKSANTWYNIKVDIDNAGILTFEFNGTSINYDTGNAFSNWDNILIGTVRDNASFGYHIDDLSINDGSGASDNSTPNSIRAYNFFDAATLNANSGFSQVGGSGILANLQDGDDDTRVSAQADLSNLDFSLPTLSGTGMSETASNFNKIEAINVYARQIEATKSGSLLKAKIEDDTAVVSREENLTLPLTVGNDSTTMFDDGSSDWSLTNLDAGALDLILTFDKP